MLALNSYTEPVVNPVEVNILPQVQELEDNAEEKPEQSKFAELLAGFLRNPETAKADISEIHAEAPIGIELKAAQKINEFTELSDTKIPAEDLKDLNKMISAERLFPDLETIAQQASEGDFYQELSNLIRTDLLPETDLEEGFFDINTKNEINIDDLQALTQANLEAAQNAMAEINKRDRTQNNAKNTFNDSENLKTTEVKQEKNIDINSIKANPENEKLGKLDEMRANRNGRRDKFSMEVNDQRSSSSIESMSNQNKSFAAIEAAAARVGGESAVKEITLELRMPEHNQNLNQANVSWEAKAGSAMENLLARELHQNFNGDIVRHASMALKDGGNATIKLALKPDTLGDVKIALEMSDNKITGKIFVESAEALEAFRKEIDSLQQAFRDAGFASADLDLSMTQNGQNTEGWENNQSAAKVFASRYEETAENTMNIVNLFIGQRKGSINLMA